MFATVQLCCNTACHQLTRQSFPKFVTGTSCSNADILVTCIPFLPPPPTNTQHPHDVTRLLCPWTVCTTTKWSVMLELFWCLTASWTHVTHDTVMFHIHNQALWRTLDRYCHVCLSTAANHAKQNSLHPSLLYYFPTLTTVVYQYIFGVCNFSILCTSDKLGISGY